VLRGESRVNALSTEYAVWEGTMLYYEELHSVRRRRFMAALDTLTSILVQIVAGVIIVAPILWLVGRSMVGGAKARFTDAIWIVLLGTIINAVLGMFVHGALGFIITLIVWILLIKHFFDAGWGKAILIGILAIVVLVIVALVLVFLGAAALVGLGILTP